MMTITLAAYKVAFALVQHGEANAASEQFLAAYGGTVTFRKTDVVANNLGEAVSQNEIIVNEHPLVSIYPKSFTYSLGRFCRYVF